jgi:hypothetical protein
VIQPRFTADDLNDDVARSQTGHNGTQPIHLHLHVPPQMTAVLMQLVTALTGQRSLFSEEPPPFSTQTGALSASVPAATRQAPESSGPEPAVPEGTPSVDAAESLLEIYRSLLKTRRQKAAGVAAIAEHESGMRAFDRFHAAWWAEWGADEKNHRFKQPVAFLSAPDVLSMFSKYLICVEGLSASTVCKRLTNVNLVVKKLKLDTEKPTPLEVKRLHSEHQKKLATTQQPAPKRKRRKHSDRTSRRIPAWSEIDAMAKFVDVASYPYGDHAPYFWRGWIRFLAYIGPRSRDVVSVVSRKPGLLREHVILDSLCPVEDINNALGSPLHSPHGWLHYPIGKDQHSENRNILFPMPRWMRDWLRLFLELSPCERVFPSIMKTKIGDLSQKQMTREWDKIAAAAGVDPRLVASEGNGNRIALRKFAANWWSLQTSNLPEHQALADKMENYVLHHVPKSTSKKHYIADQAKLLPVMLKLMDRFPLPAADAMPVSLLPE